MTRSQGRRTVSWLRQPVYIDSPHITSTANLALLIKDYVIRDKSVYTPWRMAHVRKKWMRNQLKAPDSAGGLTCKLCGKLGLRPDDSGKHMFATLDHIIPLSAGGEWQNPNNFQVACKHCNTKKNGTLQC